MQTLSPPTTGARGVFITVSTNGAYLVFGSSNTPSSTVGFAFPKDGVPAFFPVGNTIKFVSQAAGNSVVNVQWVK